MTRRKRRNFPSTTTENGDRGLPCIVFSHQDQGPVNVPDLHVPDGLEIVDVKISQLHAPPSL